MFEDQYHGPMVHSMTTVTHFSYKITLIFVIFVIDCDIELNLLFKGLFYIEKL